MTKFCLLAILAALAACTPSPPAEPASPTPAALQSSPPVDPAALYREAALKSERLGRALFEKDIASAFATELLLQNRHLAGDKRIAGWVTQQGGGSLLVTYVADDSGHWTVAHEVAFPQGPASPPTLAPTAPNAPLSGEAAVMFEARTTAIAELRPLCDSGYNTVVLPGEMVGEQGWLVYLLATTVNPSERVLAGHTMIRVSADGLVSLGATPLSHTCLIVAADLPQGTEHAGVIVTHLTTPWPLETHVYASLLYGLPIYVRTQAGTWLVEDGRIELTDLAAPQ